MRKQTETKIVKRAFTTVPIWRARLWLKKQGLFAAIDAAIEADKVAKPAIWEAWNHGYTIGRGDKLLKRLNLTPAQTSNMFSAAAKSE